MPVSERALPPVHENAWRGMHSNTVAPTPTNTVSLAQNFYLKGTRWRMRPGLLQTGAQLQGGGNKIQVIAHFEELDGTAHTVCICNGYFHEYNWGTDSWGAGTLLSGVPITVDTSAVIDWAVSRGRIIFTDGVSRPFMWDGTTWTQLTNAPISTGVEIYYDKVFFFGLLGADSNVFEWSDEGDPVNGYTGANQDWEFAQTDSGAVRSLVGLNDHMNVFKDDSVADIRGAVEDTFQTDAVREGISETEGSPGQYNIVVVDGDVYYLSVNGPRFLKAGIRRNELDVDPNGDEILGPEWDAFSQTELTDAIGVYDKKRKHILWLTALAGETSKYSGLLYSLETGAFSTLQFASSFNFESAAQVEDPDGNELIMLGDDDGNIYLYGDDANTDDNGVGFTARLRSRQYGQSLAMAEKRLGQVDLVLNIVAMGASGSFRALMRPYLNGESPYAGPSSLEKSFGYEKVGRKRYRRNFNSVGHTVGWDFEVNSLTGGLCEIHAAMTQITTSSVDRTKNG